MRPHLKLILIGLRHIADEPNAAERADILDAGSLALSTTDGVSDELLTIAQRASITASMIRRTEEMQGAFHDLLSTD